MESIAVLIKELTGGDDQKAEDSAKKISNLGSPAVDALLPLLDSTDPDVRWWALRALASLPDPRVPTVLTRALSDPDQNIQQCAALGLRLQPNPQAIPQLIIMLSSEQSIQARLAADSLIAIGEPAVLPLLEVMKNGNRQVKMEATRALAILADPRAIETLFNALNEESAFVEYWANEGLDRTGAGFIYVKP